MKFTFKENKATGRYSSFQPESHDIKLKRKMVGRIGECPHHSPDAGKFQIHLAIKFTPTNIEKEGSAPFRWVTLKKLFNTADEAKEALNASINGIIGKYTLHQFED